MAPPPHDRDGPRGVRLTGTGRPPEIAPGRRRETAVGQAFASVLLALVLVMILRGIGIGDATESAVTRLFYAIRGERTGTHDLVMVAIDDATIDAWGRPPWPEDRYTTLVHAVDQGGARIIALLEPGLPPPSAGRSWPDIVAAMQRGTHAKVIAPLSPERFSRPAIASDTRGIVESIELGGGADIFGPTVAHEIAEQLGLSIEGTRLPVNFLGGGKTLPTLSAHRLLRDGVPAQSFDGRIVLIGTSAAGLAPSVATPVGPMSAAEVHAQALLGLVHGVIWRPSSIWSALLLAGLLAFLSAIGFARLKTTKALAGAALLGVAVIGVAYALFAAGILLLGIMAPLCGIVAGGTGIWFLERLRVNRELVALGRSIAQQFSLESERRGAAESEEDFWKRLGDSINYYLEFDSMAFGALPEGAWHVDLTVFINIDADDIFERRRDIRRIPYRGAAVHHRPAWAERPFMKAERNVKTLMVPLVAFGRVVGFWIINFPVATAVPPGQLEFIRLVAEQIAVALERRRLREASVNDPVSHLPVDLQLVGRVQETRRAAMAMAHEQKSLLSLLDRLPVGGLVATLWGEIKFANQAMQRFLRQTGRVANGDPRRMSVARLIAELTGGAEEAIHEMLRELVVRGQVVRVAGKIGPAPGAEFEILLSRFGMDEAPAPLPGADESLASSGIVLTITERTEARDDVVDWSLRIQQHTRTSDQSVDLKAVVREAVASLSAGDERPNRTVLVELPESVPPVRATAELGEALRDLLRHSAFETASSPLRLSVTIARKEVTIAISDPHAILPGDDLRTIRSPAEDRPIPAHLSPFVRAKQIVEDCWGRFQITSGMQDGTEIRLSLTVVER